MVSLFLTLIILFASALLRSALLNIKFVTGFKASKPLNMYLHIFKAPGWREIKRFATKDETFAVLQNRSALGHSVPAVLPIELLVAICKQINYNDNHTHQALIQKWTPFESDPFDTPGWESLNSSSCKERGLPLGRLAFNTALRSFCIMEPGDNASYIQQQANGYMELLEVSSSADLLYRIRCVFPTASITSYGPQGYKYVFDTKLMHVSSGYGIFVSEWKGSLSLCVLQLSRGSVMTERDRENMPVSLMTLSNS